MRRAAPTALLIAYLVALSIVLAGVASTFALAHQGTPELQAELASRLRADYSADPTGTMLAPLQGEILESARRDEDRLDETGEGIEIVQVFNLGGTPPGDVEVPEPTPTGEATPRTGETPPPGSMPPPSGGTPTPTPTPTPGTTPTATPAPTPTPPPASTPSPTPAPTVTPACSPPDPVTGFVQAVTPSDGATGVPVYTNIVIRFNQPMDATTVNAQKVYLMDSSQNNAGLWVTVSYNALTYEATINPDADLDPDAVYYPAVWKTIKNACGTRQDVTVTTAFRTAP